MMSSCAVWLMMRILRTNSWNNFSELFFYPAWKVMSFTRQMIVFVFYLNCTIMNEIYSINYFHSFLYLCNSITE